MKKLVYLLLLLFPLITSAQNTRTPKITGQVRTEQGAAEYVTVRLLAAADSSFVKGVTTDHQGVFELQVEANGEYLLQVQGIGYKPLFSRRIKADPALAVINVTGLVLQTDNRMLKEAVVVATVPFVETRADKTVLNVENSVVSEGASALEILQKAPGVIIDKDDNISLKGRAGVVVMIDGKPSSLSASDLGAMLRNMNSSAIAQMEIITNPSAKYDAAGNSGIINIKTRKMKKAGFNGSLSAGAGYAKNALYSSGLNLNYQQGRFNLFGNYNYGRNDQFLGIAVNRKVAHNGETTLFDQYGETTGINDNNGWKTGVDYRLAENHTLGFMMSGFANTGNAEGFNGTAMMSATSRLDSSLTVTTTNAKKYRNAGYNANYRGTAGKHEFNVDLDFSRFRKTDDGFLDNRYFTAAGTDLKPARLNRTFAPTTIDISAAKADYTYNLSQTFKLEAGVKVSSVSTENDYRFEVSQQDQWKSDPGKTNYFTYDETIQAGYLNASETLNKWTVQAGLRAENTRSKGTSVTNNQIVDTTYLRVFPSVSLSHRLTDNQTFGLNFNQRINRPGYQDLNPFLFLLDEYTYNQGNPYLKPQYSSAVELNYSYRSVLGASAGFSKTKDVIVTLTEQDDVTKTTKAMRRNMDAETNFYLSVNSTVALSKWWSATNSLNTFYLRYEDPGLDAGKVAAQASSTHNFSLPRGLRLEVSGRYQSPITYGIFELEEQYQVDAGIQKSFLNKRGSLRLNVSDLFQTQKAALRTTFQNMDLHINERYNSRQARLTFTYRFGASENKSPNRSSGVEEETKRIRTGN